VPLGLSSLPGAARIGQVSRVHPSAVIGENVTVGANCRIGPGAVIGEPGFGYIRDETGRWVAKDHDRGVIIADDVVIGANTCVDCGSWRDTVIEAGARIDNLVHVAHNVRVGANAVVVAKAMLAGSCEIGEGAWVGPGVMILQRVTVGARALVGMGAVVLKDVQEDTTVAGNPARVINAKAGVRDDM
jgi:UDP-3-O-[3-hydroxymyristoyl] glucosamine N-acyltransferase